MKRPYRRTLAVLLPLVLAGCTGIMLRGSGEPDPPPGIVVQSGATPSSAGCRIDYRLYRAAQQRPAHGADADVLVVLAHGFMRSQDRMQSLAHAIAARGIPVATLDFCSQTLWNGRHAQNAKDMVAVADAVGAKRIVYAGFSAGGLSAVLAARADPRSAGAVTLDLVDQADLGVRAATGLYKPILALAGEPTGCNAMANGLAVYAAAPRIRVQHVSGAGHCDFEAPTDGLCELFCSDPDGDAPTPRWRIIDSAARGAEALLREQAPRWPAPRAAQERDDEARIGA